MLITLALLFAAQAPPSGELITSFALSQDYPREARRKGWEGDVTAELVFDAKGRVTACRVIKSSNHTVLDQATCNILRRRARFKTDGVRPTGPFAITTPPIEWRLTH